MDKYIEVIHEIGKFDEIIKTPRYRMCCHGFALRMLLTQHRHSLLEFLKAFCYYIKKC